MNTMQRLALAILSLSAAAAVSAESPSGPAQSTGQRIIASFKIFQTTQVEYCLRNFPELREDLSLAYTTYSVALSHAADILSKRFPNQKVVDSVHLANVDDERSRASLLTYIHSVGFSQCSPALVSYLRNATGESLAKNYGDNFESLAHQAARERLQ